MAAERLDDPAGRRLGREPGHLGGADETPRAVFVTGGRREEGRGEPGLLKRENVAGALPGGEVLLDIIDFRGIYVEPPRGSEAMEGGLRDLAGVEEVAAAIQAHKPGLLARLGGGSARAEAAAAILRDEYHSRYWSELRDAVLTTFGSRHYLGFGMSP